MTIFFDIIILPCSPKRIGGFFKSIGSHCTTISCLRVWFFNELYLIFNVAIANATQSIVTIQNRVTILLSW